MRGDKTLWCWIWALVGLCALGCGDATSPQSPTREALADGGSYEEVDPGPEDGGLPVDDTRAAEDVAPDLPQDGFGGGLDVSGESTLSGVVRVKPDIFPPLWGDPSGALHLSVQSAGGLGGVIAQQSLPITSALSHQEVPYRFEGLPEGRWSLLTFFDKGGDPSSPSAPGENGDLLKLTPLELLPGDNQQDVVLDEVLYGDHYCGQDPLDSAERQCVFDFLTRFFEQNYPFFEAKGLDWEAIKAAASQRVAEAGDDDAFYRAMSWMISALEDHHSLYLSASRINAFLFCPPVRAHLVEGRAWLTGIGDGRGEDLQLGDEITHLDGVPIEERLAELGTIVSRHHAQRFDWLVGPYLLCGPGGTRAELTLQRGGDGQHSASLPRNELADVGRLFQQPGPAEVVQHRLLTTEGGLEVGYIRLTTFYVLEVDTFFHEALAGYQDADAIILDVRGNGGGYIYPMERIAARFFAEEVEVYSIASADGSQPVVLEPTGPWTWEKSVMLLIDEGSYSASTLFSGIMKHTGRATLVGRPTGGGTSPVTFSLYPLTAQSFLNTSSGRYYDLLGQGDLIEHQGLEPDVDVPLLRSDVLQGRAYTYGEPDDPGVLKALELLQQ